MRAVGHHLDGQAVHHGGFEARSGHRLALRLHQACAGQHRGGKGGGAEKPRRLKADVMGGSSHPTMAAQRR